MKPSILWVAGTLLVATLVTVSVLADSAVPLRPIFGVGTPHAVPKFTAEQTIGDSQIIESNGNVGVGTGAPEGRLHVAANFPGSGPSEVIENADPSGDVALDFRSAGGLVGNVGLVNSGQPHFFLLENNPLGLNLTLAENGGNVGIGLQNPAVRLDVAGSGNFSGDLTVVGNLVVTGSKSSVAKMPDGRQLALYAVESTENWFEDFGADRLTAGASYVSLDPTFATTINAEMDYHVYLTPNGDCRGLYVAMKTPRGFEVREQSGGTSNVRFDYRIVARRRGYEDQRLEAVKHVAEH